MKERVSIYGWEKCPYKTDDNGVFSYLVNNVWYSPDKTKAVLEVFKGELYVAVNIRDYKEDQCLMCDYVDHYEYWNWACNFRVFEGVDWDYLKYGFVN